MLAQFRNSLPLGRRSGALVAPDTGFTLIELLLTVAILAIITAVAAPSMGTMISNNRIQGASSDLYADLALARGTAAAKGQRVTVCQSSDGATCTASSLWQQGWIVFVDGNANGTFEPATDTIVKVHAAVNTNLTVAPYSAAGTPPALTSSNTALTSVRYRPSGPTTNTAATGFRVCQRGYAYRDIVINSMGKVTSSTITATITTQSTTACS